jgi:hypothetical protein
MAIRHETAASNTEAKIRPSIEEITTPTTLTNNSPIMVLYLIVKIPNRLAAKVNPPQIEITIPIEATILQKISFKNRTLSKRSSIDNAGMV